MNFAEKRTQREALLSLTSPEMERLKKLGEAATHGEQRLLIALKMSDESVRLAQQNIRDEHPDWNENEVMLDYFRLGLLSPATHARYGRSDFESPSSFAGPEASIRNLTSWFSGADPWHHPPSPTRSKTSNDFWEN
jgi:hypothetical protein